jgi:hypothetical protein
MTMEEGMRAGSVGDPPGDEWSFTLFDNNERELLAFVFADEPGARKAAKAMQDILARCCALSRERNGAHQCAGSAGGRTGEKGYEAMTFRSVLYSVARGMGDARAISRGPVAVEKRIERRVLGRFFSRIIRAIVR